MSNIQQMMRQAQDLQQKMQKIQEKVASAEFKGQAGGGKVEITVSGKGDMIACSLDSKIASEDKEILEDLIVAAYTNAKSQADGALTKEMNDAGVSPELMNFG